MAQRLMGGVSSLSTSSVEYLIPIGVSGVATVETQRAFIVTEAGTFSNLRFDQAVTPIAAKPRTFCLRVNGSDSALTVTLSNPDTSVSDIAHSVSVSAGDVITMHSTPTSGSGASAAYWCLDFTPTTAGRMIGGGEVNQTCTNNNYYTFYSLGDKNATESNVSQVWPMNATLRSLAFRVTINNSTGWTLTFRKNGASPGGAVTAGPGVTSVVVATGLSDSIAPGDLVDMLLTGAGSAGSITGFGFSYEPATPGEMAYGNSTTSAPSTSAKRTNTTYGAHDTWQNPNTPILTAGVAGSLVMQATAGYVDVATAPGAGTSYAFAPDVDGTPAALSVLLADAATTANAAATVSLGTLLRIACTPSGTPGAPGVNRWAFVLRETPANAGNANHQLLLLLGVG